jgi:tRNA(Ile)-lysidine synthase
MKLQHKFINYIKQQHLFQLKDKLLLAVSGGVDSVVLCELCKQSGYDFAIAHCNFQLRGADSDRDEAFVKELGKKYGVEVFTKGFDTQAIAKKEKKSMEETARDLRYGWFSELLEQSQTRNPELATCNYILTAHHADDNIETLLMNFFRGTGIKGLKGILSKQGKLIRPLLFARRDELEEFARANDLAFVVDHTNAENEYTRNYFRNEIIPMVRKKFPEVKENLLRNIQRFSETYQLYDQAIEWHKKKLLEPKGNELHIPVLKLKKTEPLATIVYEIIKEYGFTAHQTDEVIALLESENGKYIQSPSHRVIRNRKWLIISPNQTGEAQHILIEEAVSSLQFAVGSLQIKQTGIANWELPTGKSAASLDAYQIKFPLLLRPWKKGDYFYPLGMKKKKKLSRFFIDRKLSLTEKEKVWVIESDRKIIWVVGMRIDERVKVTDKTENVLELTLVN